MNLSNSLSILRAPLALVFLMENPTLRLIAILLAMITDSIDGYLARLSKTTSRFGAVLDPAMDKFFVFFVLAVFFAESKIELWHLLSAVSRDFALCVFGLYLSLSGRWLRYEFRAIRWGKITTALQFLVLMGITVGYAIPPFISYIFIAFALLGLYELFQFKGLSRE